MTMWCVYVEPPKLSRAKNSNLNYNLKIGQYDPEFHKKHPDMVFTSPEISNGIEKALTDARQRGTSYDNLINELKGKNPNTEPKKKKIGYMKCGIDHKTKKITQEDFEPLYDSFLRLLPKDIFREIKGKGIPYLAVLRMEKHLKENLKGYSLLTGENLLSELIEMFRKKGRIFDKKERFFGEEIIFSRPIPIEDALELSKGQTKAHAIEKGKIPKRRK